MIKKTKHLINFWSSFVLIYARDLDAQNLDTKNKPVLTRFQVIIQSSQCIL